MGILAVPVHEPFARSIVAVYSMGSLSCKWEISTSQPRYVMSSVNVMQYWSIQIITV